MTPTSPTNPTNTTTNPTQPFTPEEDQRIIDLRLALVSWDDMPLYFAGRSKEDLQQRALHLSTRHKGQRYREEQRKARDARITSLALQNLPLLEISKQMGLRPDTIQRVCRKLGLPSPKDTPNPLRTQAAKITAARSRMLNKNLRAQ